MNHFFHTNRPTRKPWLTRRPSRRSSLLTLLFSLLFLLSYYFLTPSSLSPVSPLNKTSNSQFPQCISSRALIPGEKFLWYAPHSGFSNQLSEFKNAILMAAILNRTLIVPPVLDHHAVALGSCPKFRVSDPNEIRAAVWDHVVELLRTGRLVGFGHSGCIVCVSVYHISCSTCRKFVEIDKIRVWVLLGFFSFPCLCSQIC
jgi:hypothetical protein